MYIPFLRLREGFPQDQRAHDRNLRELTTLIDGVEAATGKEDMASRILP